MRLKIFFLAFLLSLPFWVAVNGLQKNLENYLVDLNIEKDSKSQTASVVNLLDLQNKAKEQQIKANQPIISAAAGIVVKISKKGDEQILFSKNENEILPIASLSKLMTADVVVENYNNISQAVKISEEVADDSGIDPILKKGEIFSLKNLLSSMLLESNNEAAEAISAVIGRDSLVDLMNLEAKSIGLSKTIFYNPSGRDPREGEEDITKINYSTALDLSKLAEHVITHPQILAILQAKETSIFTTDGKLHHAAITTNKFLLESSYINDKKILAGKTGETKRAGQCLLLVLEDEKTGTKIISVVLNSNDRFGDSKQLLDWVDKAYK
jgi:D-alanyl-D-alanine carboxypeptidase